MRNELIQMLEHRMEMMRQVGIPKEYDLDSPEVQNKRVYGVDLTIGQTRTIIEALRGG